MDVSDMFFRGAIPNAIQKAQIEKKLFVVYIAGSDDDQESVKFEQSSLKNVQVIEVVLRTSIALRLIDGTIEASNFSSLYPVHKIPSITIIGHNGLMLWQSDGFVNGEDLIRNISQAYDIHMLQLQHAAAGATMAMLSSANRILQSSSSRLDNVPNESAKVDANDTSGPLSTSHPSGEVDSSATTGSSSSVYVSETGDPDAATGLSTPLQAQEEPCCQQESKTLKQQKELHHGPENQSLSEVDSVKEPLQASTSTIPLDSRPLSRGRQVQDIEENYLDRPCVSIAKSSVSVPSLQVEEIVTTADEEKSTNNKHAQKVAGAVILQVRLTSGKNIQMNFKATDTLSIVKAYIDVNHNDGTAAYSLAVPYPRKVFMHEEYEKTLAELKIESRATLIVIPETSSAGIAVSMSNSAPVKEEESNSSSLLGRIFSYLNPMAYFRGSGEQSEASSSRSPWEYDPDPVLGRVLKSPGDATPIDSKSQRKQGFGPGGNIHTLKHDEDDKMFKRSNAFWNGNSTEYGGDDDKRL